MYTGSCPGVGPGGLHAKVGLAHAVCGNGGTKAGIDEVVLGGGEFLGKVFTPGIDVRELGIFGEAIGDGAIGVCVPPFRDEASQFSVREVSCEILIV